MGRPFLLWAVPHPHLLSHAGSRVSVLWAASHCPEHTFDLASSIPHFLEGIKCRVSFIVHFLIVITLLFQQLETSLFTKLKRFCFLRSQAFLSDKTVVFAWGNKVGVEYCRFRPIPGAPAVLPSRED